MNDYDDFPQPHRRHWLRLLLIAAVIILMLVLAGFTAARRWYDSNLQPVSDATTTTYLTIANGSILSVIAKQLVSAGLIRNEQAFTFYVRTQGNRAALQAGTYALNPSLTTPQIAQVLRDGKVATDLMTILPGQRLSQVRQAFIRAGFTASSVDNALQVDQYRGQYPMLATLPAGATLEGFLYPDSYQKTATTDPKEIISQALTSMQEHLTTDIKMGFMTQGLSVFQGVTLASIVEQEVPAQSDRNQAAQVFLKRTKMGMMLGSDVTAYYGALFRGADPSVAYDTPYNTRLHTGLPPGPISNVTSSSLMAVAHPAVTDWLYFVAGDDGTTHFAKTQSQHEANVAQYCHKLCAQP